MMQDVDLDQLIYIVILLAMVVGWFVASNRTSWPKTFQYIAIWGFIFLGAIAAVGLWQDVARNIQPGARTLSDERVYIPRSRDGHYHITLQINGAPIPFIVDTGATSIVLSQADARRVGLGPERLRYTRRAQTANGHVSMAPVRLESVGFDNIVDHNVPAVVNQAEMFGSLLGMAYLQRWGTIRIQNNEMILTR